MPSSIGVISAAVWALCVQFANLCYQKLHSFTTSIKWMRAELDLRTVTLRQARDSCAVLLKRWIILINIPRQNSVAAKCSHHPECLQIAVIMWWLRHPAHCDVNLLTPTPTSSSNVSKQYFNLGKKQNMRCRVWLMACPWWPQRPKSLMEHRL